MSNIIDFVVDGAQHYYQPYELRYGRTHPFCTVCGHCQPHSELK